MTGQVRQCEGCGRASVTVLDLSSEEPGKVFARALGEELRRAREERGWSRARFVELLPSNIGERTQVDLNALLQASRCGGTFRPIAQWARNSLIPDSSEEPRAVPHAL